MSTAAVQIMFDGTEDTSPAPGTREFTAASFASFMRASAKEEGMLSLAQAADVLEVSHTRVAELIALGKLTRFEFFGKRYVSCREIAERRHQDLKAGRPARSTGQRVKLVGKLMAGNDAKQWAAVAIGEKPRKKK